MAISQVRALFDGQWHTLTWNEATRRYECRLTPERTSYGQPDGRYSVTLEATNDSGETVSVIGGSFPGLTLTVRETAPPAAAIEAPEGYVTDSRPQVVFTVTDEAGGSGVDLASLAVMSDSDPWPGTLAHEAIENGYRVTFTPSEALTEGLHVIAVSVRDHDGNQAGTERSIIIDTVPPALDPADHRTVVDWETLELTGQTGDITTPPVTLRVERNGQDLGAAEIDPAGGYRFDLPLEVGENFVTLTATDRAGLSASKDLYVIRLITDRTQADVDRVKELAAKGLGGMTEAERAEFLAEVQRGAYNASDMNRVTAALEWLSAQITGRGYLDPYTPVYAAQGRTKWEPKDVPTRSQAEGYTANPARVRAVFPTGAPEAPETLEAFTFQGANAIETILVEADAVFPLLDASAVMAGEAMCGEV